MDCYFMCYLDIYVAFKFVIKNAVVDRTRIQITRCMYDISIWIHTKPLVLEKN